jgi:general secretion pathway protein G
MIKLPKKSVLKRKGFTLIEFLAIMAIIVILFAILIPVVSSVRENGRIAKNTSNLRQIGIAFLLYAGDNNNYLPPSRFSMGVTQGHLRFWPSQIAPYVDNLNVFLRPGVDRNDIGSNENPAGVFAPYADESDSKYLNIPTRWSYGISGNSALVAFPQAAQGRPMSTIVEPSRTLAAFDGWLWWGGMDQINKDRIFTWSDGKTSVLWMDGSVSRVTPDSLTEDHIIVEK